MDNLEIQGFSQAYQTENQLILKRKWGGVIIYLLPLFFGVFLLVSVPDFAIFHVLVLALPITYLGVAGVLNQVIYTFDNQSLKIQNKPIPWFFPKDKSIPASDIKKIFVLEMQRKKNNVAKGKSYDVYVELKNKQQILIKSYEYVNGNNSLQNANKLRDLILQFVNQSINEVF